MKAEVIAKLLKRSSIGILAAHNREQVKNPPACSTCDRNHFDRLPDCAHFRVHEPIGYLCVFLSRETLRSRRARRLLQRHTGSNKWSKFLSLGSGGAVNRCQAASTRKSSASLLKFRRRRQDEMENCSSSSWVLNTVLTVRQSVGL